MESTSQSSKTGRKMLIAVLLLLAVLVFLAIVGKTSGKGPFAKLRGVSTFANTIINVQTGSDSLVNGENFQNALDSAQTGNTIVLQAGATYEGNFKIRN